MNQRTCWLTRLMVAAVLPGCSLGPATIEPDHEPSESPLELELQRDCSPRDALPLAVACDQLAASLLYPNTAFISATSVEEGALPQPGQTIPAHCLLVGKMFERVGPID